MDLGFKGLGGFRFFIGSDSDTDNQNGHQGLQRKHNDWRLSRKRIHVK